MNVAMLRVPASLTGDASDVTVALEVAGALWEKGDYEEAIRWLKRAIEAASAAGDGPRAASLGQAAGDLEAALESRRQPASQPTAPAAAAAPPPSGPALASGSGATPASSRGVASVSSSPMPLRGGGPSRPPPPPTARAVAMIPAVAWARDGRIRVSVKTSVRDPTLLLLRPLSEGQQAPTGTREGFLVLSETDGDGRSNANGGGAK
jgi:hypothetical protein